MTNASSSPSGKKIALATSGALLVALIVLVTVVLPAEYQLDPLGTGKMLGLLNLSREGPMALTGEEATFQVDAIEFELASFESVEYKYRLEQGSSLLFDWRASGELVYDLHAEPDDAEEGYAESFAAGKADHERGTYVAQFAGIHGWFWENRGPRPVTLTLTTAGFYSGATEFRDGWETPRQPDTAQSLLSR